MVRLIEKVLRDINFLTYKFRYLINYIIIGFFSILLEVLLINFVFPGFLDFKIKIILGFLFGLIFSFILNAKLNFKVPKNRNTRTFILFSIISGFAFLLNLILIELFNEVLPIPYGYLRFITAGIVFIISYSMQRKFTFDFVKKVGLAVYINEGQKISKIYSKIKYYADFIHIDLLDKTINPKAKEVDLKLMQEINKTWGMEKMLHIMSKNPSKWITKLHSQVDSIIFHLDTYEDSQKLINLCKQKGKSVGLVFENKTNFNELVKYLPQLDFIQIMGIDHMGYSGQGLNMESLKKIKELEEFKKKYSFEIIFDGGVKVTNIDKINAKYIISSSGILSSKNPIRSFMELKTNSKYGERGKQLKRDIFLGMKKTVESMDFVESASVVGSFSEGKGLEGINDIDMIIILDKLNEKKFKIVLNKFENLKEEIQSKYAIPVYINNTLGPLKFNSKDIVFHLMIYDKETHKEHCIKSPFTCFDWQKSKYFFKKPMEEIYKIHDLQLKDFFNSRRSSQEYLKNLKENVIPYRTYSFHKGKVIEKQNQKEMDKRDKVEFSYHIIKFLIMNFIKLYYNKNHKTSFENSLLKYFEIFPENKKYHLKTIESLLNMKNKKIYQDKFDFLLRVERFVKDFEYQFKQLFEIK